MRRKKEEGRKVRVATVWSWGERFQDVKGNCEKYVKKRWEEKTKECLISFFGRERDEGISLGIDAYTSDIEKVGDLAERLFYSMVFAGNIKVYSITIKLFEDILSSNEIYRDSMEEIEKELEKLKEIIPKRFINDPKVGQVAQGRKVSFIWEIYLLCEMESEYTNKIVIELAHSDFEGIKDILNKLSEELIENGLAKRILGYRLWKSVEDLKVEFVDVYGDEASVFIS
ncbi:MAG: hypothetical protein QXU11_00490 [Thermoproteota archaeon]